MRRLIVCVSSLTLIAAAAAQPSGRGGGQPGGEGQTGRGRGNFIDRMMANDANGDGKLQWEEVPERMRERLFESADSNADKVLDKEELEAMASRMPPRMGRDPVEPGDGAGAPMTLDRAMRQAGRAARALRQSQFTAESREADLAAVQSLQSALVAAKGDIANAPMAPRAKEKYGDDTEAFRHDIRKALIEVTMQTLTLEMAINDGDARAAAAARDRLLELQRAAHQVFQPEDEERGRERRGPGGGGPGGGRRGPE